MMRCAILLLSLAASLPAMAQAQPVVAGVARPVTAHSIEKGARFVQDDLVLERRDPREANGALEAGEIVGMEATRRIMAGSLVRSGDVVRPRLVRRGEAVVIRLQNGPLTITSAGKALSDGAAADSVRVVSTATNRTLDAVVAGPGVVTIAVP